MKRSSVAITILIFALTTGAPAQEKSSETTSPMAANSVAASEQTAPTEQAGAEVSDASAAPQKEDDGAGPGDSHVRIVRLSETQGRLGLDRGTGKVEATMQNMPIVEGSRLITGDGYAEVEFEDGSTLRITPNTEVDFPQLILRSTGTKATTVRLVKGTAYVTLQKSKDMEFTVKSGEAVITVEPDTHIRIESDGKKTTASVFKGNATMQAGQATATLEKKHTATLETANASSETIVVSKKVAEASFDEWDKNQADYHNHYAKGNAFAGSPYGYGISDLNYYGGFVNAGGCGSFWRPYFAGTGWDPYGNGVWAWYRGAGYSWVSPYPWGWLPYHSGAWSFCPGVGWGWRPGGAWLGLANVSPGMRQNIQGKPGEPTRGVARGGWPIRPPGPVHAGGTPRATLLLSNRTPLVRSRLAQPDNFVFEKNSAGLGVPRGSLGNLHGISSHVERNGFVNHEVYMQPMTPRGGDVRPGSPMALRSGSPSWARETRSEGPDVQAWHGGPNGSNGTPGMGQRNGNPSQGAPRGGGGMQSGGGGSHGGGGSVGGGGSMGGGGGFHGGGGSGGGGGGSHGGGSGGSGGHR